MHNLDNEAKIISFIVRVWMDEPATRSQQIIWRGHITPIPNGTRRYFSDINDIPDLIAAHMMAQR